MNPALFYIALVPIALFLVFRLWRQWGRSRALLKEYQALEASLPDALRGGIEQAGGPALTDPVSMEEQAENGDPDARLAVGAALLAGDFGIARDAERGLAMLQSLVEEGQVEAMLLLAEFWFHPEGTEYTPDADEALRLMSRAAEAGHGRAAWRLAEMYRSGTWVEEDPDAALEWLEKSAANGYAPAAAGWARHLMEEDNDRLYRDKALVALLRQAAREGDRAAWKLLAGLSRDKKFPGYDPLLSAMIRHALGEEPDPYMPPDLVSRLTDMLALYQPKPGYGPASNAAMHQTHGSYSEKAILKPR